MIWAGERCEYDRRACAKWCLSVRSLRRFSGLIQEEDDDDDDDEEEAKAKK